MTKQPTYVIKRYFYDDDVPTETVITGVPFEVAQRYCSSPETSSRTAKSQSAHAIAQALGPWFCGFHEDTPVVATLPPLI